MRTPSHRAPAPAHTEIGRDESACVPLPRVLGACPVSRPYDGLTCPHHAPAGHPAAQVRSQPGAPVSVTPTMPAPQHHTQIHITPGQGIAHTLVPHSPRSRRSSRCVTSVPHMRTTCEDESEASTPSPQHMRVCPGQGHTATLTGPVASTVTRHPPPSGMERVPSPRGSCRKTSERVRIPALREPGSYLCNSSFSQYPDFAISVFSGYQLPQVSEGTSPRATNDDAQNHASRFPPHLRHHLSGQCPSRHHLSGHRPGRPARVGS